MESDENEELSAADALARASSGRESIARRVAVPWAWDASMAASIGLFMGLIAYVSNPWTAIVIAFWVIAFARLTQLRERRTGVVADGSTRRTFDMLHVWGGLAALAVFAAGLVVGARWWEPAPVIAAVLATAIVFGALRWVNRRAIARIRSAS